MTTPDKSPQLGYASALPWHRRRRTKWMSVGIVALLVLGSSVFWGPWIVHRGERWYWINQCKNFRRPPGTIVYDSVHPVAQRPRYRTLPAASMPVPLCLSRLMALLSPPGLRSDGTIFLHLLHCPAGDRLVSLDLFRDANGALCAQPRVIRPNNGYDAVEIDGGQATTLLLSSDAIVYSAQTDSDDASHFSFQVIQDRHRMIFDGWLTENQKVVIQAPKTAMTLPDEVDFERD